MTAGVEDAVGVEVRSQVRSRTLGSCGLAQPSCDKQAEDERAGERGRSYDESPIQHSTAAEDGLEPGLAIGYASRANKIRNSALIRHIVALKSSILPVPSRLWLPHPAATSSCTRPLPSAFCKERPYPRRSRTGPPALGYSALGTARSRWAFNGAPGSTGRPGHVGSPADHWRGIDDEECARGETTGTGADAGIKGASGTRRYARHGAMGASRADRVAGGISEPLPAGDAHENARAERRRRAGADDLDGDTGAGGAGRP